MSVAKGLLLFATMLALSRAHIGGYSSFQDVGPDYYCGRSLARAVAAVCYDVLPSEKRASASMYQDVLPAIFKDKLRGQWALIPPEQARALPARNKRYSGIVSECCDNPCTVDELRTYCG